MNKVVAASAQSFYLWTLKLEWLGLALSLKKAKGQAEVRAIGLKLNRLQSCIEVLSNV